MSKKFIAIPRNTVLAIDPGISCGYAMVDVIGKKIPDIDPSLSGVWDLSQKRFEGAGMRLVRLRSFLRKVDPNLVAYEELGAMRQKSSAAAEVRNEIIGVVKCYCESNKVPYTAFSVAEIKKRATKKGNAGKEAMVQAAIDEFGAKLTVKDCEKTGDDDIADALWILQLALENYGQGL
tara:strand:- start:590 stop:1123 length:534 start_codon:yes stop_codon:yes gene_type:complete